MCDSASYISDRLRNAVQAYLRPLKKSLSLCRFYVLLAPEIVVVGLQ
jgi:hypothetical protein